MDDLLYITLALALAGFAKGLVGLGLPPISMGLLVLVMSPVEAAALMVVPAAVTNLVQAFAGRHLRMIVKRFWQMLCLTGMVTLVFAGVMAAHADLAIKAIGVLLFVYAGYSLSSPEIRLSVVQERWGGPLAGAATGFVTAFTGVSSMPSVPFLQAVGLDPDALVQAMGVSFSVSAFALGIALGATGMLSLVPISVIAVVTTIALIGMQCGAFVRKAVDAQKFRMLFLVALLILGFFLALR